MSAATATARGKRGKQVQEEAEEEENHGPADDEAAGRVQVVDRLGRQVLGGDHGLYDLLFQVLLDLLVRHFRRVLHRDDHRVHAQRHACAALVAVFDRHLRDMCTQTLLSEHALR